MSTNNNNVQQAPSQFSLSLGFVNSLSAYLNFLVTRSSADANDLLSQLRQEIQPQLKQHQLEVASTNEEKAAAQG